MSNDCVSKPEIKRSWIIGKSACVHHLLARLIAAVLLIICALFMFGKFVSVVGKFIGAVMVGVAVWFVIMAIVDLLILVKLLLGKYSVRIEKVYDVRFRRPYAARPESDRMLSLGKINVTVDAFTAAKFSPGSTVILVFLDKVKYPIIIANMKEYTKDCD